MRPLVRIEDVPAEGFRFTFRDGAMEEEGILLRLPDGSIRAWRNLCRHLPMPLDERDPGHLWSSDRLHLACAAHGALYRPEDGLCVAGPCRGSHLKPLPVEVRDGIVYLDESRLGGFLDV